MWLDIMVRYPCKEEGKNLCKRAHGSQGDKQPGEYESELLWAAW